MKKKKTIQHHTTHPEAGSGLRYVFAIASTGPCRLHRDIVTHRLKSSCGEFNKDFVESAQLVKLRAVRSSNSADNENCLISTRSCAANDPKWITI